MYQEAVAAATRSGAVSRDSLAVAAAAVVLSRSAWETFFNEYIEIRNLPVSLKGSAPRTGIKAVFLELKQGHPSFALGSVWRALADLNGLRNAIAHHTPIREPRDANMLDWMDSLEKCSLIALNLDEPRWERRFLVPAVASWACEVTGSAMLQIEAIPLKRSRGPSEVPRAVREILGYIPPKRFD
jgi:hypothetical protein